MIKLSKLSKTLSTVSVTVILLAFIAAVGGLTLSKHFGGLLFSSDSELSGKERISIAFEDEIAGFDYFKSIYSTVQRLLGVSVYDDAGYTYVIKDSEDNLHFHTVRADAAPYAESVAGMRDALSSNGIPLLYIQAPTKEIDGYTKYPLGISYATVENAADMTEELLKLGVDTVDLSAFFAEIGADPAGMFYRTDHHWTTESAFTTFSYIVPYIAENYGLPLDVSVCNTANWQSEAQPESFLGSIGRRIGAEAAGLDDYTFIEPKFKTSFEVYYPKVSDIYPNWAGDFRAAFVRDDVLYSEDVNSNRYASYFQYDFGHLIIKNRLAENGVRIAIVKDSFALPFTAFMSTAVSEIDMIDLREFEGSVTEHLIESAPDIVIILYSGGSFSDIMYEFTG